MEIFRLRQMVLMEAIFRIHLILIPEETLGTIPVILPVTIRVTVLVIILEELPEELPAIPPVARRQMMAIQLVQTRISRSDGEGNGR